MRFGGAKMEETGKRGRLVGEIRWYLCPSAYEKTRCNATRHAEEASGDSSVVLRGERRGPLERECAERQGEYLCIHT